VKQALVTAKLNDKYNAIVRAARGLVFFGTPHRGGNGASVAEIASRVLGLFSGEPPSELLPVLRGKSIFAETVSEQFQSISLPCKVASFFEQMKTGVKLKSWYMRTAISQMVCLSHGPLKRFRLWMIHCVADR
jgi:hypothetical protein